MGTIHETAKEVVQQYPLGTIDSMEPILEGLVNRNFYIQSSEGHFVLQHMAPIFDERTVHDMQLITDHLRKKNIPTIELVATNAGKWCYRDSVGHLWKLMATIDGHTYTMLSDARMAYEAGRALGMFIDGVHDFDGSVLQNPLRLHQTQTVYDAYSSVYEVLCAQEANEEYRAAYEYIFTRLPEVMLPAELPRVVVHGDPKISNIIFDGGGKAICMIDIDTCMVHTPLVDIGDALRSWCGKKEDDPENTFDLAIFEQAIHGYLSANQLTEEEKKQIYNAVMMITLELASRFAKDVIDDNYFGWNNERFASRKEHNAARALSMVQLARDIERKQPEMSSILSTIA
jgi:Ser/Thr protein kinase RdoA (MazF antagonist)